MFYDTQSSSTFLVLCFSSSKKKHFFSLYLSQQLVMFFWSMVKPDLKHSLFVSFPTPVKLLFWFVGFLHLRLWGNVQLDVWLVGGRCFRDVCKWWCVMYKWWMGVGLGERKFGVGSGVTWNEVIIRRYWMLSIRISFSFFFFFFFYLFFSLVGSWPKFN